MNNELYHHGIKGQRWGVRRFQNPDGTLTDKGRKRLDKMSDSKLYSTLYKRANKQIASDKGPGKHSQKAYGKYTESYDKAERDFKDSHPELASFSNGVDSRNWEKAKEYAYSGRYQKDVGEYNDMHYKMGGIMQVTQNGSKYSDEFLKSHGRDITYAHIRDIGLSDADAKRYTDRLINSGTVIRFDEFAYYMPGR